MTIKRFYKVLVISIDIFESKIIDERHFTSKEDAEGFINTLSKTDYTSLLVEV